MRATGANVCGALVWTGPAVKARCRKERVIEPAYTSSGGVKMNKSMNIAVVVAGLLVSFQVRGQVIPGLGGIRNDTATISVTGIGEVHVSPARAIVFLQIVTDDSVGAAAAFANAALRSSVKEQLASLGLDAAQVTLWGYGAGQRAVRGRAPNSAQMGSEAGYEAKSGLRVVVEPVNRLDEVVSAVLLAGASSISFVEFEAGEAEEARREAARIAVSRARTTAESIAEAAGGRLGDLVNITVLPDYSAIVNASRFFQGAFMGQGVQLYPSQVTMKVQVQVSWVFEAR